MKDDDLFLLSGRANWELPALNFGFMRIAHACSRNQGAKIINLVPVPRMLFGQVIGASPELPMGPETNVETRAGEDCMKCRDALPSGKIDEQVEIGLPDCRYAPPGPRNIDDA